MIHATSRHLTPKSEGSSSDRKRRNIWIAKSDCDDQGEHYIIFRTACRMEASEASFTIGKQFEKTEKNEFSREASSLSRSKCRASKPEPRRYPPAQLRVAFAHASHTLFRRCLLPQVRAYRHHGFARNAGHGLVAGRGGIFRRSRPPHFSFPTPPTPVIGRVRRVATVRGGEVRAAIHVRGMVGLNRAEGHRNGHTEDCLECDCTPTAGGGGRPRFQPPARLRVSPRVWNGRARGTGERRRTLRDHGDT